eukprot:1159398-Pelagomonas_calceolata.AAC.1
MKQGTSISLQDFTDDLRLRMRGAWRAVEGNWFQFSMLDENISPAANQPDSQAVGQPLVTLVTDAHAGKFKMRPMFSSSHQPSVQDVSNFLLQRNKKLFNSMSELLELLLAGMDQPQADQLNSLAEGLPV